MDASEFLEMWLQRHGAEHPLTPQQKAEFLTRSEVSRILQYPDHHVAHCTRTTRKLTDILECLRSAGIELPPGRRPTPTAKAPRSKSAKTRTSNQPTGSRDGRDGSSRAGRSRAVGSVWQPPVNRDEAKQATVDFDKQDRQYP